MPGDLAHLLFMSIGRVVVVLSSCRSGAVAFSACRSPTGFAVLAFENVGSPASNFDHGCLEHHITNKNA